MEAFLTREATTGHLIDPEKNQPFMPPENKVNWDGQERKCSMLWYYLRTVGYVRNWSPKDCVAVFPATADADNIAHLHDMLEKIKKVDKWPEPDDYTEMPFDVDGPDVE
jgi:hypothetical protein